MNKISNTATAKLEKLRARARAADAESPLFKIPENGFMPLWFEQLNQNEVSAHPGGPAVFYELWSAAHWYTQNGDVMRDPEVVFLRASWGSSIHPTWYPVEFRTDPYLRQEIVILNDDLSPKAYAKKQQRDCAAFVTTWMDNLTHQHPDAFRA